MFVRGVCPCVYVHVRVRACVRLCPAQGILCNWVHAPFSLTIYDGIPM